MSLKNVIKLPEKLGIMLLNLCLKISKFYGRLNTLHPLVKSMRETVPFPLPLNLYFL